VAHDKTFLLGQHLTQFFQKFHSAERRVVCADLNASILIVETRGYDPGYFLIVPPG